MSFNANDLPAGGKGIEPLEAGTYPARIQGIYVLGLQPQEFEGEAKDPKINIGITYELLDEFLKDEEGEDDLTKPRWQTEVFPFNRLESPRAKSTIRYTSLDQEMKYGGDFSQLLDLPCMLSLVNKKGEGKHKGKTFTNVSSVAPMRTKEALKAPELVHRAVLFDFYEPTKDAWDALPDWIKEIAKGSLEYEGSALQALVDGAEDEAVKTGKEIIEDDKLEKKMIKSRRVPREPAEDNNW